MTLGHADAGHWRHALPDDNAVDVPINDRACWSCVPCSVWNYAIGGRRVLPKWLSYSQEYDQRKPKRKPKRDPNRSILGRPLTAKEAAHFTFTARRLARLVLLAPKLDKSWDRLRAL